MAMVTPMTNTFVAEHFPLEKRSSAIGWLVAGAAVSYLIGAPAIGFIAGFGGWRMAFLGFVLPVLIISLLLTTIGLPSTSIGNHTKTGLGSSLEGYRNVFSMRSATACIAGTVLRMAAFQIMLLFPSFYRKRFLISMGSASIVIAIEALCFTIGSLVTGRFVDMFGRKPVTVYTSFLSCILITSVILSPNLWLALIMDFIGLLILGLNISTANSLTLEQVPRFRGTMMSMNSAAGSIGSALGVGVGGLILLFYDYEVLGLPLGAMGIAATIIYQFLAVDPTRA